MNFFSTKINENIYRNTREIEMKHAIKIFHTSQMPLLAKMTNSVSESILSSPTTISEILADTLRTLSNLFTPEMQVNNHKGHAQITTKANPYPFLSSKLI